MSEHATFESEVIDDNILTIVLRGSLDMASAPEFDHLVQEHLSHGHTRIIVDCRHLGYLSSVGIGSLVALQTRLRRKGGEVKLAAVLGPVMDVVRAVRLDKMLGIYGDLEFARQAFIEEASASQ